MGESDIAVRPATTRDAAGIARVHVDSWRFAYRGLLPQAVLDDLSVERRTEFWQHAITHPLPHALTLVAVRGDQVIGFCNCGPALAADTPDHIGEVATIYVDPALIRQGVGRRLMDAALDHLAREGFTDAELWVLEHNTIGRRFYEGYGWTRSGRTKVEAIHGASVTEVGYHLHIADRHPV